MNERFPFLKVPPPSPGMPVSRPPPSPRGSPSLHALRYDPSPYSSSSSLSGLERPTPPPIFSPAAPSPSLSARSGDSRVSRVSRISRADLQKPLPPAPPAFPPPPPIPGLQPARPPTRRSEVKEKRGRRRNSSESSGRSSAYSQRQVEDEILDLYYAIQSEQKALRNQIALEEEQKEEKEKERLERKEKARTRKKAVEKINKRLNLPSPAPLRPTPSTASDPARRSIEPQRFSFGPSKKHGQTYQRRNSDIPISPTELEPDWQYAKTQKPKWDRAPWDRTENLASQYRHTLLPRTEWPPTPPIPTLQRKKKNADLSVLPYADEIVYAPRPMSSRIIDVELSAPGPSNLVPAPLAVLPGRLSFTAGEEEPIRPSYLSMSSSSSSSSLKPMRSLRTSARKIFHRAPHQRDRSAASNMSLANSAHSKPSGEMLGRGQGSMRRMVEDTNSAHSRTSGEIPSRGQGSIRTPIDSMYETVTPWPGGSMRPDLRLSSSPENTVHVPGKEERSPAVPLTEYQVLGPVAWDRERERDKLYSRGKDRNENRGSSGGFGWFKDRKNRLSEEKKSKRREELKKKIVVKGVEHLGMGDNWV